jgi:hypothetical protein
MQYNYNEPKPEFFIFDPKQQNRVYTAIGANNDDYSASEDSYGDEDSYGEESDTASKEAKAKGDQDIKKFGYYKVEEPAPKEEKKEPS